MTRKYGFSDDVSEGTDVPSVKLPDPKPRAERPSEQAVAEVARRGQELGFVSREPTQTIAIPTSSGRRKKTEPQDKMMIAGPSRVLKAFRDYCDAEGLPSYWAGIERLMKQAGLLK